MEKMLKLGLVALTEKSTNEDFLIRIAEFGISNYQLNVVACIDDIIHELKANDRLRTMWQSKLNIIIGNLNIHKYYTDNNILEQNSILSVLTQKIENLILPNIEEDQSLTSLVNSVFYNKKILNWYRAIPLDRWHKMIEIIMSNTTTSSHSIIQQLKLSLSILIDRVRGGWCDSELMRFMDTKYYNQGPFSQLCQLISDVVNHNEISINIDPIQKAILECISYLDNILMQKDKKGISLELTIKINRIKQQFNRILAITEQIICLNQKGYTSGVSHIIYYIVREFSPKNFIIDYLKNNLSQITFMATYHNGKTGEKYITNTRAEYLKMLYSASMGGLIVAFLCVIKLKVSQMHLLPLWETLGYSLNYAIGFTIIYLANFTLATKQPAMTAARIAQTLSGNKFFDQVSNEFSTLFARLFRTQFVAFIGNVIMCLIVASAILLGFRHLLGVELVPDYKAQQWVEECTKPDFKVFYFGAIAGIFLFFSGMASGLVINYLRYINAYTRMMHHPLLKYTLSYNARQKLVAWVEKNAGGIVGNVLLGFLLGGAYLVGKFTGIPFDIRHITFQAGHFALGLGGIHYTATPTQIIVGIIVVFGIGWFNFIVSFILSSLLALKANQISFRNIVPLMTQVFRDFIKKPSPFFYI